ncbi:putative ribonuclease H-like domain-containing protein [Tanacetum coccineum]
MFLLNNILCSHYGHNVISSSSKRSDDKAKDYIVDDDACRKTVQEPASEYDQALKNVLNKMMDQEKEATEQLDAARKYVGAEDDFNNMEPSTVVSPIPTTRVHSIHPKAQIIGDPKSAVQTRGMTKKNSGEHAMISYIQKQRRTNHKDFQNCLFACFLSQHEPTKISQALDDESWVEAMQEELLQFKIQKMDVKSAFLYGTIEEEVYVCQPPGFVDPEFPEKVYKVEKALYGLHQAPRAWFQMSSMGELTFFLGLQVKQKEDGIFISQDKYVGEILKKFGFSSIRTASTPMETNKALTKDEDGEDVDVHLYRCLAWTGNHNKRLQFLVFKVKLLHTKIHLQYESAICVVKNPVYHSKTKHIEIRHHFIRDSYKKRLIEMSGGPSIKVGDEAVHKELGDIMERAATTASSFKAEQT